MITASNEEIERAFRTALGDGSYSITVEMPEEGRARVVIISGNIDAKGFLSFCKEAGFDAQELETQYRLKGSGVGPTAFLRENRLTIDLDNPINRVEIKLPDDYLDKLDRLSGLLKSTVEKATEEADEMQKMMSKHRAEIRKRVKKQQNGLG